MPALQPLGYSIIGGADEAVLQALCVAGNPSTFAMAALNTGWDGAFVYEGAAGRDIATVYIKWQSVTSPGTMQLRIETDSNGKPSGTLYDANAVLSFTPAAGWQALTYPTSPSTNLTPGNTYHIVLLTTVAGTTQTLHSHVGVTHYPGVLLTAADGTTRTNFAQGGTQIPIATLVFTDSIEETQGFCGLGAVNTYNFLNNAGYGVKVTLTGSLIASGVEMAYLRRSGTPAGSPRCRVFDSSDNVIANTTVNYPVALLTQSQVRCRFLFPALVTLAAGTYRIIFDNASHNDAASGNSWSSRTVVARVSGNIPSDAIFTQSTDVTVAHPTWTDTNTEQFLASFIVADTVAGGGGGGGGLLLNSGMVGGLRG